MIEFSKIDDFVGSQGDFSFELTWEESSCEFFIETFNMGFKNLKFNTNDNSPKRAIYHSLCKLLKNSDIDRVRNFSSRELDSFLRDENHIPSMESGFPDAEIKKFTETLLAAYVEFLLEDDIDDWKVSKDSTYVERIQAINDFMAIKVNVIEYFSSLNLEVNLVHLTEDSVFIELKSVVNGLKLATNSIDKEMYLSLERVVRRIIGRQSIKLVAE
jgi:hypothetical protein